MSKYTFTFKKNDIFVDFSTTDKEFVEKQFQIWVTSADIYAKNQQRKSVEVKSEKAPVKEEKIKEPEAKKQKNEESKVVDKASTLLKSINTAQPAAPLPVGSVVNLGWGSEILSKTISQSAPVEAELTEPSFVVSEKETHIPEEPSVEEELPTPKNDFEEILEQSIENPTFEPVKHKDEVYLSLIKSKNTTDKFHYLIITAYYLSEFEKLERFTLKQINAKLMQNLSEVIDHFTLQEAINQNFIELIPDLTGTSEIGEYRLTPAGEEFFANRI